jgi:hypothetical protein
MSTEPSERRRLNGSSLGWCLSSATCGTSWSRRRLGCSVKGLNPGSVFYFRKSYACSRLRRRGGRRRSRGAREIQVADARLPEQYADALTPLRQWLQSGLVGVVSAIADRRT